MGAETQRADGLTVRGNRGKINEGSDRERGGGGEVETETERQNHWRSVRDTHWQAASEKEGACSTWEAAASLGWGGESLTGSRGETHVDKLLWSRSGGGERGWSLNLRMRSVAATWLSLGVSLGTCSVSLSTPAIKETGAIGERAAEIMRVAESSCGFTIFGDGRSSRSCGFTDSSRASWSCSITRSPHSENLSLSRDEGRICSQGVTGASCGRCHSVECTCGQSSGSRCTADVKVTTAVQLSAVIAIVGGAVAQDTEWPVWLMKATWIRLLKRAKGGRVKSSDACVSTVWVCIHH